MKRIRLRKLKSLLDQLPLILAYLLLIGLVQLLVWLKDDQNRLALDLLRFFYAPFFLWILWRLWRKISAQQQLLAANQQNQLPNHLPPETLSQTYYQVLADHQERFQTKLQQLRLTDQQRKTYFNLWSHEMKLPVNQQLLTDRKWLAFCLQRIVFNVVCGEFVIYNFKFCHFITI